MVAKGINIIYKILTEQNKAAVKILFLKMNDDIKSAHGLSVLAIGKIARLATLMKNACIEYFIRK